MSETQEFLDKFYFAYGPCCAGCDWWRSFNSSVGECLKSNTVSDIERWAMLGLTNVSLQPGSGHIVTKREHHCGGFKDEFDWQSLPLPYRKRVGAPVSPPR